MKKSKKALCTVLAVLTLFTGTAFAPEISSYIKTEPVSVVQSIDANATSAIKGRFNILTGRNSLIFTLRTQRKLKTLKPSLSMQYFGKSAVK
ncbi:MAG: hypothetical protein K2G36_03440 [Ruminococcus sp.]|nr:hypothetical protein [Ruminococcus sp.]